MEFGLVIVGDEILSGKRQDKHLVKLIELLGERGLRLSWARYVGDDPARITAELRAALASGAVVFCCGGIGATPDDHTRQSAAAALGLGLALHPEAAELIHQRMKDLAAEQGQPYEPDRPDNLRRLEMGVFPVGAEIVPNPYNRIPGFSVASPFGQGALHCLPGFPVMAWPMMAWLLDTRYAALHGEQRQAERSVIVYGAMESALIPLMEAVEAAHPRIKVFSLPSVDHPVHGRHIELGVKGAPDSVEAAYAMLREGLAREAARVGPEMVR